MTTIVTRQTTAPGANNQSAPLTIGQFDSNLIGLNTGKLDQTPNKPSIYPTLNLDFTKGKLDPRVTFSRTSSAVYYDGKTNVLAEQNLFIYSQNFSYSGWVNALSSDIMTVSGTAPDGSVTSGLLIPSTILADHGTGPSFSAVIGNTYTISIYAKAKGYTNFYISDYYGGKIVGAFDLSGGVVISGSNASIVSVGNGWY